MPNIILTRGAGNAEDVAAIPGYYTLYREVHFSRMIQLLLENPKDYSYCSTIW